MAASRSVADKLRADQRWSREPEPVEAEFETAAAPTKPKRKIRTPLPRLSRSASRIELAAACLVSAVVGGGGAVVYSDVNSNAPTGTLAREIDALRRAGAELDQRQDRTVSDMTALRARIDGQSDRLATRERGEQALHREIDALTAQLLALTGEADQLRPGGQQAGGAAADASPLGTLLTRLESVEAKVADDGAAETPRQMQRSVRALTDRLAQLEAANASLAQALDRRQLALAAVESSVFDIATDIDSLAARVGHPSAVGGPARPAPIAQRAPNAARALILLAAMSDAARTGSPFQAEFDPLVAVLPGDADIAALTLIARRGAPTLDQLRRDFESAAAEAGRIAAHQRDDGWGWFRTATSGVMSRQRRDTAQMTARLTTDASQKLGAGDIAAAVAATDGLSGAPARTLAGWREAALRRVTLDKRLAELNARLGAGGALTQ